VIDQQIKKCRFFQRSFIMETNTETPHQGETLNNDLQSTLTHLSQSVSQLQTDVSTLLSHSLEAGKSGVDALRSQAHEAVDGIKNRVAHIREAGNESRRDIEERIERSPVSSVIIAMGIGFIVASILHRK
jgi:ElaB/YqjD/DUF883 family membrane-anchored ribosome-binding protein